MTLPTRWTFAPEIPSAARFRTPAGSLTKRRSEIASVRTRFTSSGIVRSKERRPATRRTFTRGSRSGPAAEREPERESPPRHHHPERLRPARARHGRAAAALDRHAGVVEPAAAGVDRHADGGRGLGPGVLARG